MSATILQFPQLRASTGTPTGAQPLAPALPQRGAGALSPAQELYMDDYLERAINDSAMMASKAATPEAFSYWLKVGARLCRLRMERQNKLR